MLTASLAALAALALAWLAAAAWGRRRWAARTQALHARLDAATLPPATPRVDFSELAALPPPVQRYLRAVLQDGAPVITAATLTQHGQFNLAAHGERWRGFTATQRVRTRRPGFVWDARIALLPGFPVRVHDAYVAGEGVLHPALLGLASLGELHGTAEVAAGELMRYLAEAACYPSALLPGQGVHWTAVDADRARATLSDGAVSVSLLYCFDADGLVRSVRAEGRGRTVGRAVVPTAWEGRWSGYRWQDGMRVPCEGEAAWLLADGPLPYWRGRITRLAYTFAA